MLAGVRHKALLGLGFLLLTGVLGACTGELFEADIGATVEATTPAVPIDTLIPPGPVPAHTPMPSGTPSPSTRTPRPTNTPIPTATLKPPTPTEVPSTSTPEPAPTPTEVPSTSTPEPAPTPTPTPTPTSTYIPTSTPVTTTVPSTESVKVRNYAFAPVKVTVEVGETVTWKFVQGTHTTTGTSSESWNSGNKADGSFSHTFNSVGTFPYVCNLHSFMTGTVVVE